MTEESYLRVGICLLIMEVGLSLGDLTEDGLIQPTNFQQIGRPIGKTCVFLLINTLSLLKNLNK